MLSATSNGNRVEHLEEVETKAIEQSLSGAFLLW